MQIDYIREFALIKTPQGVTVIDTTLDAGHEFLTYEQAVEFVLGELAVSLD